MTGLALKASVTEAIGRQWFALASPGAFFRGLERLDIAEVSRAASADLPEPETAEARAAQRVSHRPDHVNAAWIAELDELGLPIGGFVEVIGIVSRLRAIDTVVCGIGSAALPLPDPIRGDPTGEVNQTASKHAALVPIIEPSSERNALSMLPSENDARLDLQEALYFSPEQMEDLTLDRELDRIQIELLAAHTAFLEGNSFGLLSHATMLRDAARDRNVMIDLRALVRRGVDPIFPSARVLLDFNDSVMAEVNQPGSRSDQLDTARQRLRDELGDDATNRAAAVIGSAVMSNRVLSATGIPATGRIREVAHDLDLRAGDLRR